jgi:uncharacterized protein (TIGR03437 family)
VGGLAVPVIGPVAQSQFAGLDQINVGPLPQALSGAGMAIITIRLDGIASNSVTCLIQ